MSRPLLRSRWAWIAREHIQKHLKLPPKSRPFSSSITPISLRCLHSFADPDTTATPARAFPIDVIDHQAAVRKFDASVRAGNFEEAREVLLELVDRHAAESNLDVFRQLRAIIVHSEKPDVKILLELGLSLAMKGFAEFVKAEIAPAVEEHGTVQAFSRFQVILETLEKTQPKPKETSLVFEEASDDYTNVLSQFPFPPPSVMELIQEQLSPMLPDQTTNDQSIFEQADAEYSLHATSSNEEYPKNFSANALLNLVKERRFEQAYELLTEMQHINTPIPPSHLYEVAALDVLRNSTLLPPEKLEQFTKWFSLIPPRHDANPPRDFAEVRYRLLQSPTSHIELLKRCALILASKGYTTDKMKLFLPAIFIFSPPETHKKFILELERRNLNYWLDHSPVGALQQGVVASAIIRGYAIRCLTYGGHIDQAMAFLNGPNNRNNLTFPIHTYDVLLKKLKTSPISHFRNYIPLVERLRAEKLKFDETQGMDVQGFLQFDVLSNTLDNLSLPADPTNLASMLRYLRRAIFLDDPHRILPSLLTNFMDDYLETGRTFALQLLLRKALSKSHAATKLIMFAEMRLYRQHQQFDLLITAFVQNFHIAGVPREEVQAWYDQLAQHEWEEQDENLTRVSGYHPHTLLMDGKLWPDLEQCHLVWEALIYRAQKDEDALMRLYNKFIHYARRAEDPAADPALASVEPLPMSKRFGLPVSGPTFHAFMHYMLPVLGPDFGHKILADMWDLDLWPGKYHYGTLARYHAEHGHLRQVFAIIDKLESGKVMEDRPSPSPEEVPAGQEEELQSGRTRSEDAPGTIPLFMQPDAPFYINIMQGLIYSKNVEAVEEVHRRLQRRCPCPETYEPLARALKKLADLKALLGSSDPPQHAPAQHITSPLTSLWGQPPIILDPTVSRR